jgi:hypothetical protein
MQRFSPLLTLLIVVGCFVLIVLARAGTLPFVQPLVTLLYEWTITLTGFALLLAIVSVLWLHLQRVQSGSQGWAHSLVLVVTLLIVFVAGLMDPAGAGSPLVEWLFDHLLAPGQATLFALLAFFMAAAAFRYLRIGRVGGAWMLAGALITLLAQMPATANLLSPVIGPLANWLLDYPIMATLRGVLLGSALTLLIGGVRFLLGRETA